MALFEVIRKVKDDDNLVWKYPKTNFNTQSQLIVHESQEAIFFANGKALDLFGPGKYTLNTNNIPLLRNLLQIPTGFRSPFQCEVYFIDKTEKNTKWGTSSKIEFLEPKYHFPIQIGACGELKFTIDDSRKFLIKLVGIKKSIDNTTIDDFFNSYILTKVKSYMANIITENKICIFEIDRYLNEFSEEIRKHLKKDFEDYGIQLNKFFITTILKPEEDKQYLRFKELFFHQSVSVAEAELRQKVELIDEDTKAKKNIMESQSMAIKRNQEGYSYQEERYYDIGENMAKNEAIGQYSNIGVGLGIMSGIGSGISDKIGNKMSGILENPTEKIQFCPKCGTKNQKDDNFCSRCGFQFTKNLTCPDCHAEIDSNSSFCPKCGRRLGN